jgi:hypothetical protein
MVEVQVIVIFSSLCVVMSVLASPGVTEFHHYSAVSPYSSPDNFLVEVRIQPVATTPFVICCSVSNSGVDCTGHPIHRSPPDNAFVVIKIEKLVRN